MRKFIFLSIFLVLTALIWTWYQGRYHPDRPKKGYKRGQYIDRLSSDPELSLAPPQYTTPPTYAWNIQPQSTPFPVITKEFFRCKGSILHPLNIVEQNGGEPLRLFDCGGAEKHGLPLKEGKEFIYPVLIRLLNHVQDKTHKKVIVTSGHQCPQHHTYCSPLKDRNSKHQIGAEVDFYVKGMEYAPEEIVNLLIEYFTSSEEYQGYPEYLNFKAAGNSWSNKEVLIKIYPIDEGRDFDNQHPYPYVNVQVSYDREKKEQVSYSWPLANKNYLRF